MRDQPQPDDVCDLCSRGFALDAGDVAVEGGQRGWIDSSGRFRPHWRHQACQEQLADQQLPRY